ncbi:8-oxoguanine deaminase [Marinobacterium sp. xm-d-579]|uniref:8-oxoguanine deaminase n=1 Tax=Marinobacterium sp. xm-d-579 TaxID=2497734 RepID=UPI001567DB44|nr:8-oxoguanine deaminase [Marinobacterium sp. xm-d-579]NRP36340.1 8-oxoguanine deaminase [Marinobacterium sp. xm-d-579]
MTDNLRIWLSNPLAIYTGNDEDASGGIVVSGKAIVELVAKGETPVNIDQTIDVSDQVLIPGLINTHHHFYQTLTRALPAALNKELFPWLQTLYPVWANLDPEIHRAATKLALAELLLSGCTTASDHHYLFPANLTDAIDHQIEIGREMGVRMAMTRGSMSLGQDQGGLPPNTVVQTEDEILQDSERLVSRYHDREPYSMSQIALAPCSPFSVTTELMRDTASLAKQLNVRLHTHLAETIDEENFCERSFGMRTVDYLESVGWLSSNTWLAHGIHFNDEEIARLGKAGVGVCHCPSSNMMLASGIAKVKELEAAGSPVGLGVDGSASNDCSNMIQEVRQAMYIQRLRYGSSAVTHFDAYRWGTKGSAQVLGRDDIGELAVGKAADLALFKLDEPRFSGAHDPLAALLLCGAHRAEAVMVNGEWRVKAGELVGQDIERIMHEHKEAANTLAARAIS